MHKLRLLIAAMLLIAIAASPALADGNKGLSVYKKEYKQTLKQLKNEGWKTFDGEPLEAAVGRHYQSMEDAAGTLTTLTGYAKSSSPNVALRAAKSNAAQKYAAMKETKVKAETTIEATNASDGGKQATQEQTGHSVVSKVDQRVKNLKVSMSLMRQLPGGDVEVKAFYLIEATK